MSYTFSDDWFSCHIHCWNHFLGPLQGRPGLTYLEIGLFEGRSAIWMLENILTHPTSRLIGIDSFSSGTKDRFEANLRFCQGATKAHILSGESRQELMKLEEQSCDVIYVDGSHSANDVLVDAVLSWPLLKSDGLLIFDDYEWKIDQLPSELCPKVSIDAFITAFQHVLVVEFRDYQVIVRKSRDCRPMNWGCAPIGTNHVYDWLNQELTAISDGGLVDLTREEIAILEMVGRSKPFGSTEYLLPNELIQSREYQSLKSRLQFDGQGL